MTQSAVGRGTYLKVFARGRLRTILRKRALPKLYAVADKKGISRSNIVNMALASFERWDLVYDGKFYKPSDQFELTLIDIVVDAVNEETASVFNVPKHPRSVVSARASKKSADIELVLKYSEVLIGALSEALEYDPNRHHNSMPAALWRDDKQYLRDVKALLDELLRLNSLLVAQSRTRKLAAEKWAQHLHKFLGSYASTMGKGAAGLTIGVIASFLYKIGIGQEMINHIWGHFRLPK